MPRPLRVLEGLRHRGKRRPVTFGYAMPNAGCPHLDPGGGPFKPGFGLSGRVCGTRHFRRSHPEGPRFHQRAEGSRAHRNCRPGSKWATFPVGDSIGLAYNYMMQISLEPNLEARLNQIASEAGKAANQVVEELVANYIDHDAWFKQEVNKGLLSLDAGKFLSHDDVRRRIDQILGS